MASPIDNGVVLVTGASSGIGTEIARLVAPRARVLVLVARRVDRLDKLKDELVRAHPKLEVEVIACDLSKRDEVAGLVQVVVARGLEVDVLVNNAGVGLMGVFDRQDLQKNLAMLDLNVTSVLVLTASFLPGMVARGRGGLLNISSGFGLAALPSFASYIATKHFITGFSDGLHADLAGTGVVVTQVCPGPVETEFEQGIGNFTGRKPPGLISITAAHCASAAVRGLDRRRGLVVPGLVMKLVMAINWMSPRFLRRFFAAQVGRIARRTELSAATAPGEAAPGAMSTGPDPRP